MSAEKKPRLSKLGKLVEKMLEQEDSWALYKGAVGAHLKHTPSSWVIRVEPGSLFDFPNFPSLSPTDQEHLYPLAKEVWDKKMGDRNKVDTAAQRNIRYNNRKHIYSSIMRSVLGVDK